MITPDMYTPDDFSRGDLLITACAEVTLAYSLSASAPALGGLEKPFNAYLDASQVTPETIEHLKLDPQVAQELAMHGLRYQLQLREYQSGFERPRQAEDHLDQLYKIFLNRKIAIFPAPDYATFPIIDVVSTMAGTSRTKAASGAVAGVLAKHNMSNTLRLYRQEMPEYMWMGHRSEVPLFIPDTAAAPAIRLAITDIPYEYRSADTRPRRRRLRHSN